MQRDMEWTIRRPQSKVGLRARGSHERLRSRRNLCRTRGGQERAVLRRGPTKQLQPSASEQIL